MYTGSAQWLSGLESICCDGGQSQLRPRGCYVTPTVTLNASMSRPAFISRHTQLDVIYSHRIMATDITFEAGEPPKRPVVAYSSLPQLSSPFFIDPALRSYKHQYSNIYFVRLVELRPIVEEHAEKRWANVKGELSPHSL